MKEKIILKSIHPEEYPDLVIECRVVPNDKISEELDKIPEDKKFYAYKSKAVKARRGKVGEVIKTVLKVEVDGKEYIFSETEKNVQEGTYTRTVKTSTGEDLEETVTAPDVVVTNYNSTSNEEYVVTHKKFMRDYELVEGADSPIFMPRYDSRLFAQVDENLIIITAWGAKAVCLAGSYIVTYNAAENDYNAVEKGAFESTYTREKQPTKKIKK